MRTTISLGVALLLRRTGQRNKGKPAHYAGGPEWLIKNMKKIQSQSTSNPCSIAQAAAVAALDGSQDCVKEMLISFKKRHDYVVGRLNELPGVSAIEGDGTFYAFADFNKAMKTLDFEKDTELAALFLEKGVALVPGSAFGSKGCMRLSFATSDVALQKALDRLQQALA